MKKIISFLFAIFVFIAPAIACETNEIDVLGDGTQCETAHFTLTTISTTDSFQFMISAVGTFYVDCGNGGTLTSSADDISGNNIISRSGATFATYTCTWDATGEQTIRFGGRATNYSTGTTTAAIRFNTDNSDTNTNTPKIASISGSLSAIFPYITENAATGAQPRFYYAFRHATRLTSVPDTLFENYTTPSSHMFRGTFHGCTKLNNIPATLFSRISGAATYLFNSTFYGCTSLTSIPDGLFAGISGASTRMFYYTFYGCTKLADIPATLFSGVSGGATYMFYSTFEGCTSLTSIPAGLFSRITNAETYMFYHTFYGCTKITGYIPASTFAGLIANDSPTATNMWANTFYNTGLATSCPDDTVQYITGYSSRGIWDRYVSCITPTPIAINLDTSGATAAVPATIYVLYGTVVF